MTSYIRERDYDRDALPSIRRSGFMDPGRKVTFGDGILRHRTVSPTRTDYRSESPHYQPRPPSPSAGRRTIIELQDQARAFKDELRKKDALIQQLVRRSGFMDPVEKSLLEMEFFVTEPSRQLEQTTDQKVLIISLDLRHHQQGGELIEQADPLYFGGDRHAVESARSDLVNMQVKTEKLQMQVRQLQSELDEKDMKLREMKVLLDTSKENEARLSAMLDSQRMRMSSYESKTGSLETVATRSELTLQNLQRENRELQEKTMELESRLRKQLDEREHAENNVYSHERKYHNLLSEIRNILAADDLVGPLSSDDLVRKLTDFVQENAMLKGKIVTLKEMLNSTELETKASRETIMRLVSEVGKEQKVATRYTTEMDNLRMERENALSQREDLEREVQNLRERLDCSKRALESCQSELDMKSHQLSTLDSEMRSTTHSVRNSNQQYSLFREKLASILADMGEPVDPSEDSITSKISRMQQVNAEYKLKSETLEDRVKMVTEQLETQYELHKSAAERARKAEVDAAQMEDNLRHAEGELSAGDVLRDGFKTDKEKYLRTLQRLGEIMKMDRIATDLGLDMTADALVSRAEQLVRHEASALSDKSTHVYNLQRKVKSLKEQIDSKELHNDLLRKKIATLEERIHGKTEIERERDSESFRVRKLEKLVDKYKLQVQDARQECTNLKAQLLGSSELRVRTMEQNQELEDLVRQVDELEQIRQKQARKIADLKHNININQHDTSEKRVVADNAVHALSSELRTTKNALDAISGRERQLLDFRNVVSRMLGLDINTLAIPDYEIISRLEKLIQAHHTHAFTTMSMEDAMADMEDGFLSGYEDYRRGIPSTEPASIRRSRERAKRKAVRARARSVSPVRRDPRAY
ncbi:hypothetical protein ScPMuIL_014887 [Solemya velum]